MKYAAAVFRNITISADSVKYGEIADALLSGGVLLDEIVQLPYDRPDLVMSALERLMKECDGVFVICDKVLIPVAREAVSAVTKLKFEDECLLRGDNKLFAALPTGEGGKELVRKAVIPAVDQLRGQSYFSLIVKTVSAPVSKVMTAIAHAEDEAEGRLSLHTSEENGICRIEIIYNKETPKVLTDEVTRILVSELEGYVYALNDVSPAEQLYEALRLHHFKVATAESFTGGRVGAAIVSVPGASKVFYEGLNVYDSAAKIKRLGVTEYTLRNKGAVSKETAQEMAAGLLKNGCDVAIATTGIAGPQSDGSGAPVGLCYIAIGTKENVRTFEYRLSGDRENITKTAVNLALFLAYREIH